MRTKEQAKRLSTRLAVISVFIFVVATSIMNYGALSSSRSIFIVSFFLALLGAVVGGWAVKIRTGRLALGIVGGALLYVVASLVFAFSVLLIS